jgi:hypothetical protein
MLAPQPSRADRSYGTKSLLSERHWRVGVKQLTEWSVKKAPLFDHADGVGVWELLAKWSQLQPGRLSLDLFAYFLGQAKKYGAVGRRRQIKRNPLPLHAIELWQTT